MGGEEWQMGVGFKFGQTVTHHLTHIYTVSINQSVRACHTQARSYLPLVKMVLLTCVKSKPLAMRTSLL